MFKTKQEKIQNEKKEKITDNHYEAKNKLSMRKESKHHKKNCWKGQKKKKKQEAKKGAKEREIMTHVNVISVVMSSSNVLDLNAYKYQRSYPDMGKKRNMGNAQIIRSKR